MELPRNFNEYRPLIFGRMYTPNRNNVNPVLMLKINFYNYHILIGFYESILCNCKKKYLSFKKSKSESINYLLLTFTLFMTTFTNFVQRWKELQQPKLEFNINGKHSRCATNFGQTIKKRLDEANRFFTSTKTSFPALIFSWTSLPKIYKF